MGRNQCKEGKDSGVTHRGRLVEGVEGGVAVPLDRVRGYPVGRSCLLPDVGSGFLGLSCLPGGGWGGGYDP